MLLENDHIWVFYTLLPLIAFLYASIGYGGASGYLALMALFSFSPQFMKPTALLLNLFVAAISFYHFWKEGYFNKKLFLSFAISSIPLSFVGGIIDVDASLYKKVLAVLLVFSILRLLNIFGKESNQIKKVKVWQGTLVGGCIGFFSGLIGIGGGIILSPLILLMKWGQIKEAAAVSALFIWFNSAAGLGGQLSSGVKLDYHSFILVGFVVIGGFAGGYVGSKKFKSKILIYLLACILATACIKLFFT